MIHRSLSAIVVLAFLCDAGIAREKVTLPGPAPRFFTVFAINDNMVVLTANDGAVVGALFKDLQIFEAGGKQLTAADFRKRTKAGDVVVAAQENKVDPAYLKLLKNDTIILVGVVYENRLPDAAQAILEKADRMELFSLDPKRATKKPKQDFHGWKVLGQTVVKGRKVRKRIVTAVEKGIAKSDGSAAACFDPRHGIRATHKGKSVDLVICFECLQIEIYVDNQKAKGVLTTQSPETVLDTVLRNSKVPLAPKPKSGRSGG
jgi:hypothetical protein